jgi:ParB family chromosome partitioning protein
MAGLVKVPVTIRDTDDQEKLEIALVENIQRQDLNPLEEAKALRKLLRDFKLGQADVAKRVGRSRSAVANCLRLLDLHAEVQQALLEDRITAGHAKALLACKTEQLQTELLAQIEDQHLSVRQTERLANTSGARAAKQKKVRLPDPADATFARDARQLASHLGAKVQLVDAPNGGRIVIEYYSEEERNRLVDKILNKKSVELPDIQDFTV